VSETRTINDNLATIIASAFLMVVFGLTAALFNWIGYAADMHVFIFGRDAMLLLTAIVPFAAVETVAGEEASVPIGIIVTCGLIYANMQTTGRAADIYNLLIYCSIFWTANHAVRLLWRTYIDPGRQIDG
jgi:hypothetical protein